jgi:hypothetical protein
MAHSRLAPWTLVFAVFLPALGFGMEDAAEKIETSVWTLPLPEIDMKEVPLSEALQIVTREFKLKYPNERRFKGIFLLAKKDDYMTITLSAKEIPFGVLVSDVANAALCTVENNRGLLRFVRVNVGEGKQVWSAVSITDETARHLELSEKTNEKQLRKILKDLRIKEGAIETIKYDFSKKVFLVEGRKGESDLFIAAIKLMNRGMELIK